MEAATQASKDLCDSLNRYHVDNFKTTSVPHVQLDLTIYKPSANQIAFTTTEERFPIWIEVMKLRYKEGLRHDVSKEINCR